MKVGIIGLTPRQVGDVMTSDIGAEINIYDKEHYGKDALVCFCNKNDEIVLLAGHAPRPAMHYCDKSKTHIVPGNVGISGVIRFLKDRYGVRKGSRADIEPLKPKPEGPKTILRSNPGQASMAEQLSGVTVKSDAPAATPPSSDKPMVPHDWLASMLTIKSTEYLPPSNPTHAVYGKGGRFDHTILEAASIGDTVRYPRDGRETLDATSMRFAYVRKSYSKKLNRMLEVHIFKNHVDVFVSSLAARGDYLSSYERCRDPHALIGMMQHGQRFKGTLSNNIPSAPSEQTPKSEPKVKPGTLMRREPPKVENTQEAKPVDQVSSFKDLDKLGVQVVEAKSDDPPTTEATEQTLDKQEDAPPVKDETPPTPAVEEAVPPAPATVVKGTAERKLMGRTEEIFWKQVYVAVVQAGGSAEYANGEADKAVWHLRAARSTPR